VELALPTALLLLGLASSAHCLGMCGGIVGAFSTRPLVMAGRRARESGRQLAFNLGRITSYAAAGAIAGGLGAAGAYVAGARPAQVALYLLANVVVILMGLYLAGLSGWIARLERLGAPLWRRLQPLAARLAAASTLKGSYAAGMVWGWLPCGLVYGALAAAAFAGTPGQGAIAMLAFGLGTAPALLAAGVAAARLRAWMGVPLVRRAAGGLVIGFGTYGLALAGTMLHGLLSA
jgi:uncharacterized protein